MFFPVSFKLIICLEIEFAAFKLAKVDQLAAVNPMLSPIFISERFGALATVELRTIEWLNDESIHILSQVDLTATIGARTIGFSPFSNARGATKLTALFTLFRLLHNMHANGADKIRIQITDCFLSF